MDKMREEFEVWYSDFDGYGEAHKKEMWDAWQASRAALCVQMPRCCNEEQDSYRLNIIDSLDDAGVRHE